MTTSDEIIDAELVEDRHASPGALVPRSPSRRVDLVVTAIHPRWDFRANAARKRLLLMVARFVLVTAPRDVLRGVGVWFRRMVRDYIGLALVKTEEEIHGKPLMSGEKRLEERRRRILTLFSCLVLLIIAGALAWWLAPAEYWTYGVAVLVLALWASGHHWRAPEGIQVTDERPPGWDGTVDSVRRAFAGAKVLGREQNVWFTPGTQPEMVGEGVQLHLDLDAGITWIDIQTRKEAVGSGLGVDSDFIVVEKGRHDGQAKLWFAEEDPYRHGPQPSPLMEAERWSAWEAAPFGRTPHGFDVPMTLMYSNFLGGGLPGAGKSWSARTIAAPFILDPDVRCFVANGKGCGAWKPMQNLCGDNYILGARAEAMERLDRLLDLVIEEMDRRNAYAERQGTSKVVPEDGFPPWLVIIDELQNYTGCSILSETKRGSKTLTWGEVVTGKLITIAKTARSSAIILVLLTQKPGEKSLPTDLRDSIGTRFANRVGNATTSFQVLGLTTKDGVDASTLPTVHTGIGILRPDAELGNQVSGYPVLRPYAINDVDWQRLGERGYALRRQAGTHGYLRLSEEDAAPVPDLLQRIMDHVAALTDEDRVPSRELREALAPEMTETAFGLQLRRWGSPTGRGRGNKGPSGPLVGDLRRVAQRIREGGPIELF